MNYVLVSPAVAQELGKTHRTQVGGLYVLEDKDFDAQEGEFLFQRVAKHGGQIISHRDAIALLNGAKSAPVGDILSEEELEQNKVSMTPLESVSNLPQTTNSFDENDLVKLNEEKEDENE